MDAAVILGVSEPIDLSYVGRMDLLVLGGSGFLGREIIRQALLGRHHVTATFHTRALPSAGVDWRPLDLRHRADVTALVAWLRPDVIINVAYRQGDWATTADGAIHVALAVASIASRLVHVSSDAVFAGTKPSYDETDLPDPTTPYGAAKAAAETAVKAITPTAVIARTSLIIGDGDSPQEQQVHALAGGAGPARCSPMTYAARSTSPTWPRRCCSSQRPRTSASTTSLGPTRSAATSWAS